MVKALAVDGSSSSPPAKQARGSNGLGLMPSDHTTSPFRELEIAEIWEGIGRTRVRQHVNPLRREHQRPTGPLDWTTTFTDPARPLVVDLGCGPGRFLMLLQRRRANLPGTSTSGDAGAVGGSSSSDSGAGGGGRGDAGGAGVALLGGAPVNYLGVEIRKPVRVASAQLPAKDLLAMLELVERANEWAARLGCVGELHYVHANATISLASMTENYPGPLAMMAIQFPDPHFKRRHRKRRIFQPQTVRELADRLAPGGLLFLQSDVELVAAAMRNIFEKYASDAFELHPLHSVPGATFFTPQPPAPLPQHLDMSGAGGQGAQGAQADEGSPAAQGSAAQGAPSSAGGGEEDVGDGGEGADDAPVSQEEEDDDYESMESVWAAQGGWLQENPLGVPTEREYYVQQQGLPVFRVLLVRK